MSVDKRSGIRNDPNIPADTELWAALQSVSGGSWGGCVYDTARIKQLLARPSSP